MSLGGGPPLSWAAAVPRPNEAQLPPETTGSLPVPYDFSRGRTHDDGMRTDWSIPFSGTKRWVPFDPDMNATYWYYAITRTQDDTTGFKFHGQFAHARYQAYNVYNDDTRDLVWGDDPAHRSALSDVDIVPDPGSRNPYLLAIPRDVPHREYTVSVVPEGSDTSGCSNVISFPTSVENLSIFLRANPLLLVGLQTREPIEQITIAGASFTTLRKTSVVTQKPGGTRTPPIRASSPRCAPFRRPPRPASGRYPGNPTRPDSFARSSTELALDKWRHRSIKRRRNPLPVRGVSAAASVRSRCECASRDSRRLRWSR